MKVRQGLPDTIMDSCGRVAFGRCLCGRSAQTGSVLHVPEVDHRHELAADVVAALGQAIGDFAGSAAQFDDVAMVVMKCLK